MLEEELVDLFTLYLKNPDSSDATSQKDRITAIGHEIHADGGLDAMINFFFAVRNRVVGETGLDTDPLKSLWNDVDSGWSKAVDEIPDESSA